MTDKPKAKGRPSIADPEYIRDISCQFAIAEAIAHPNLLAAAREKSANHDKTFRKSKAIFKDSMVRHILALHKTFKKDTSDADRNYAYYLHSLESRKFSPTYYEGKEKDPVWVAATRKAAEAMTIDNVPFYLYQEKMVLEAKDRVDSGKLWELPEVTSNHDRSMDDVEEFL